MSKFKTILQGMALTLAGVVLRIPPLPLLTLAAVLLARWDKEPTVGSWGTHPTIRGDVPRALRWLQTTDERLPGGLYEPTVEKILDKAGRVICSWYWIGWRNVGHGLRNRWARPSTIEARNERFEEIDGVTKGVRSDGTWYYSRALPLGFKAVAGFRIYLLLDNVTCQAVPTATIKKA